MGSISKDKRYFYTDKNGDMRGSCKNEKMDIWDKWMRNKREFSFSVTIEEIDRATKMSGNSLYAVYELTCGKYFETLEQWIENSETEELKRKRREHYDSANVVGKFFTSYDPLIESAVRVILNLYKLSTGKDIESTYERYIKRASREKR